MSMNTFSKKEVIFLTDFKYTTIINGNSVEKTIKKGSKKNIPEFAAKNLHRQGIVDIKAKG